MRSLASFLFTLLLLIPFASIAFSQSLITEAITNTTQSVSDINLDTLQRFEGSFEMKKNAWVAMGLSAVLPGTGQLYNEDYWKIPVIWSLGGYWVYEWINNNRDYHDFRNQYTNSITSMTPYGDERLLRLRDFYRDQRDSFAWYLGLLYFLNLLDAYVGANLYDFDVSPDLGADGRVVPKAVATVRWKF